MENPTVKQNVRELVVVHARQSVAMEDIVVKDPKLATLILEAVPISRNGPFYRFKIQTGDVSRHLVVLLMNQLMNIKNLTENSAYWTMIIVFCNITSHWTANQISDFEAQK